MTGEPLLDAVGAALPAADAHDWLGLAADRRPGFGEYLGAQLREGWWSSLAGQGAAQARYRLGGEGDGDGGPIPRDEYEAGPLRRERLDWFDGLTRGEARRRTEAYDAAAFRRREIDARGAGPLEGTAGFAAAMAGAAASPESLLPFGPAFRAASGLRFGAAALRGAGAGARAGLLSTAAVSPLVLGSQALTFGDDVGFADLVLDLAVGTSLGAAFGAAGGVAAAWRARDPRVAPSLDRQARAVDGLASAAADIAEGRPVDLSAHPVLREQAALRAAYDEVRAQSQGPADDPLVLIEPGDIEAIAVERGGWEGIGDVTVPGRGYGLVKIIWKHGEGSPEPPGLQVTRDDVLALTEVARTLEPAVLRDNPADGKPETWEWRVERPGPDGTPRTLVYGVSRFRSDDKNRLVTIFVQEPGREPPRGLSGPKGGPSTASPGPVESGSGDAPAGPFDRPGGDGGGGPPQAAGPPGVPRTTVAGPAGDTAAPLFLSTGVGPTPGDRPGRIPDSRSPEGPAPDNVGGPARDGNDGPRENDAEAPSGAPAREVPPHWRVTRDEFLASRPRGGRAEDVDPGPTLRGLPERGPPGLELVEPAGTSMRTLVARDADGRVEGYATHNWNADAGELWLETLRRGGADAAALREEASTLTLWVRPDRRRRGVATRLYEGLRRLGANVDAASGLVTTDVGARFAHREAVRRALAAGLPVPGRVLADYPDLARAARPPSDPSPGAPPPDPHAEAMAELDRADEAVDPLADPGRDPDLALFEAQAAAGRLDPDAVAAFRAAAAEADRLANVDKAWEAAALCVIGGGAARSWAP